MKLKKETFPRLLDPEGIGGHRHARWLGGRSLAKTLEASASEVDRHVQERHVELPPLGVLINARRPRYPERLAGRRSLPTNVIKKVMRTLDGIDGQDYPPGQRRETLVMVDRTMNIRPADRAELEARATLVPVSYLTSNPAAWNLGLRELMQDVPSIGMLLDAGSHYATNQALRTAALTIESGGAAAAFGSHLADEHSSVLQSVGRNLRNWNAFDQGEPSVSDIMERATFVPADGMTYDLRRLPKDPFDLRFGRGGANTQLLKSVYDEGASVVYHPALSVQSGEDLGLVSMAAIARERASLTEPTMYQLDA